MVVGLYVDDIFVIAALLGKLAAITTFIHFNFRMKDLGEVTFPLGMEIEKQVDGNIHLIQH